MILYFPLIIKFTFQVEIVKEEAEKQRLQREEMEVELQVLRHQLLTVPSSVHIHNMLEDRDTELSRFKTYEDNSHCICPH